MKAKFVKNGGVDYQKEFDELIGHEFEVIKRETCDEYIIVCGLDDEAQKAHRSAIGKSLANDSFWGFDSEEEAADCYFAGEFEAICSFEKDCFEFLED